MVGAEAERVGLQLGRAKSFQTKIQKQLKTRVFHYKNKVLGQNINVCSWLVLPQTFLFVVKNISVCNCFWSFFGKLFARPIWNPADGWISTTREGAPGRDWGRGRVCTSRIFPSCFAECF